MATTRLFDYRRAILLLVFSLAWPLNCARLVAQSQDAFFQKPAPANLFQPSAAVPFDLVPADTSLGFSRGPTVPTVDGSEFAEEWQADEASRTTFPTREPESQRLKGEFGDGFALLTEDEEYELRIHVLNQVDYKGFFPTSQTPNAQSGFYIPRMRLYFEGQLTDPLRYEISLQRSVEGVFDLLDANLDIRFHECFQLRIGRTLIPYSYTWYDHLEQYFIAPERPLFPLNFGLSRAAGIQLWGRDEERIFDYSVGIYDGRVAGVADDPDITDGVGYLNVRPLAIWGRGGPLENFNIGGSIVVGAVDNPNQLLPFRTSLQSSENDEAANAASAVFLEANPNIMSFGDRLLGAIHAAWYGGPCSLEAEWNAAQLDTLNETTGDVVGLATTGFHITGASFLTGETVRRREAVTPLRPFNPRQGLSHCGAWEVFARYSYLNFDDILFDADLADRDEWTDELWMTDIGVNWYLNRYTKFYFDWQHAQFASPVLVNEPANLFSDTNDLLWMRCQVYF